MRETTDAPIALGGAAYSLQPETLLTRLGADFGIVGEGERAFREVLGVLKFELFQGGEALADQGLRRTRVDLA